MKANKLGDWPWRRSILADSLIRMKELGTNTAIFDIEYISPSLKKVFQKIGMVL